MNTANPHAVSLGRYAELLGNLFAQKTEQMEITLVRSKDDNYTPASLMYAWAQENGGGFRHVPLGGSRLIYRGKEWKYDHWAISPRADGKQLVTLTLIEA